MTYDDLDTLIATAQAIHRITRDPMILSAQQVLLSALPRFETSDDILPTYPEELAIRCVTACEDARKTLFNP